MKSDVARFLLGGLLNLEIWIMAISNIVCLLCIYRGRLHLQNDNPVLVVTSLNLLFETLQLLIHCIYVGPAIWIGDWIFDGQDSLGVTIAATGFLWLWFLCSLNQILMAFNRLSVVCFPSLKLTKHHFLFAFSIATIVAATMVAYSGFISPCCRYSYLIVSNTTENSSMKYVDFPIDVITSAFCIISYVTLFVYIFRMQNSAQGQTSVTKREIRLVGVENGLKRLCVQFVIVYLTYNFTWSSFFFFPMLGIPYAEAYMTTTVVFMANCGMNAIILLLLNKEVKREFYKLFGMTKRLNAIVAPSFTPTNQTR